MFVCVCVCCVFVCVYIHIGEPLQARREPTHGCRSASVLCGGHLLVEGPAVLLCTCKKAAAGQTECALTFRGPGSPQGHASMAERWDPQFSQ